MNIDTRYTLERYRQGGSNRYTCPKCGRRKCFTRYIDTETGYYLSDDCGKCDHESSCGHHHPPRDFFRDHPELRPQPENRHDRIGNSTAVLSHRKPHSSVMVEAPKQSLFFPIDWAIKGMERPCTFTTWMRTLPMNPARLEEVLAMYYVGGTSNHYYADGIDCGAAVVFWQIDELMRPHDAKVMAYGPDGHRKGYPTWMRAICAKKGKGPQLENTDKVLFGLHLLPSQPDVPVAIVESEKTALICACRYPQLIWLATGGCGYLNPEKLHPLKNRRLVVVPDSGKYADWSERMRQSGHRNYCVADLMEHYPPNTDIADLLLAQIEQRPRIDTTDDLFAGNNYDTCPY